MSERTPVKGEDWNTENITLAVGFTLKWRPNSIEARNAAFKAALTVPVSLSGCGSSGSYSAVRGDVDILTKVTDE